MCQSLHKREWGIENRLIWGTVYELFFLVLHALNQKAIESLGKCAAELHLPLRISFHIFTEPEASNLHGDQPQKVDIKMVKQHLACAQVNTHCPTRPSFGFRSLAISISYMARGRKSVLKHNQIDR